MDDILNSVEGSADIVGEDGAVSVCCKNAELTTFPQSGLYGFRRRKNEFSASLLACDTKYPFRGVCVTSIFRALL